jgi:hypothetical protein
MAGLPDWYGMFPPTIPPRPTVTPNPLGGITTVFPPSQWDPSGRLPLPVIPASGPVLPILGEGHYPGGELPVRSPGPVRLGYPVDNLGNRIPHHDPLHYPTLNIRLGGDIPIKHPSQRLPRVEDSVPVVPVRPSTGPRPPRGGWRWLPGTLGILGNIGDAAVIIRHGLSPDEYIRLLGNPHLTIDDIRTLRYTPLYNPTISGPAQSIHDIGGT